MCTFDALIFSAPKSSTNTKLKSPILMCILNRGHISDRAFLLHAAYQPIMRFGKNVTIDGKKVMASRHIINGI